MPQLKLNAHIKNSPVRTVQTKNDWSQIHALSHNITWDEESLSSTIF